MRYSPRHPRAHPILPRWGPILAALLLAQPLGAQTPNVTPDQSVRWGDLHFHYELEPNRSDRISLTATVTNTGERAVELRLPWCLAWLRVHRDGRRIWDRGEAENCTGMERFVRLRPRQSERDRYVLLARDLFGSSGDVAEVEVHAYLPTHRVPWLPPRAAVDLPFGTVTLAMRSPTGADAPRREFARTLGVPGLPWGASARAVRDRLTGVGFRPAGSDPNGSLLFNGHDFLGRNAGLIARLDGGRLVKLVALMEPLDASRDLRTDFREVRETLRELYGEPARAGEEPRLYATWERWSTSGLHAARLAITSEGNLRLDLEPPSWKRRYLEARASK